MAKKIHVNLNEKSYDIIIKEDILKSLSEEIKKVYKGEKLFIITDDIVARFYLDKVINNLKDGGFSVDYIILPNGEKTKSIESLEPIYNALIDFNMTRKDMIITLGGGVIGDLGGFVASTFLRGVGFIQIPTTLLSQVDSSVGGKVAIDLKKGKNLVGSFHQPKLVLIDTNVLTTLSLRNIKDGLAEVIKYGLIFDKDFFEFLSNLKTKEDILNNIEHIVYTSCNLKRIVVEEDEKDTGERMKLNFGHTLAHGIEAHFNYEKYTHGEAVAIGMYEITKHSEKLGLTPKGVSDKIKDILINFDMEYDIGAINNDSILSHISSDKKNEGKVLNVILLNEIGKCYIHKTNTQFFKDE
ncbi:3-dehydroquinate synthase [Anaerofustis sp. LCP19S3_F7]|uniref:3-dehydroquinate synthase n=1 Tax=Anaerofustis sp. LCP19S3_F7 TaxID=3440247 RepID=UPI003F93AF64